MNDRQIYEMKDKIKCGFLFIEYKDKGSKIFFIRNKFHSILSK